MRKLDPTQICVDFEAEIAELESFFHDVVGDLEDRGASDERLSTLSELTFHRGYVAFESFISALFIGCINRDASVFLAHENNRVRTAIAARFTQSHARRLSFTMDKHLRAQDIAKLVNPDNANITFSSAALMITRSQEWLAPRYAAKFSALSAIHRNLIDTARILRNCIAHQSGRSYSEMNEALLALPATGVLRCLRRGRKRVWNIGSYLKTDVGNRGRIHVFLDEFSAIAAALK